MTSEPDPRARLPVAVIQLSSQDSVPDNLAQIDALVARAASAGAQLVLLPENFAYMGTERGKRAIAEHLPDDRAPIQAALRALARRERVTLIAGGFPERTADPERPHNTSVVVTPEGTLSAVYRKVHL
ncbi:MAG TPA: nitrilase-related carbon-nitrogen hydrolase, partial [Polyangiaceae bacterium]|nr:nitrilase-related carbon-nitrogen hydrolase [Polyangiaceae bacterium]